MKIFRFIFNNWQAKLGSVLLALLFYINLQSSKLQVKTVHIPIDYPKLNGNVIYSKSNPKTIQVKVEGFRELVNYYSQFLKVIIEPNELTVGDNIIEVKKIFGLPSSGLKVTPITPKITVTVETIYSKVIPVEVTFEDDLGINYIKASYFIKPNNIIITGQKNLLEKITKYSITGISLKDANESFTRTIRLNEGFFPKGITANVRDFQLRVNILKGSSDSGEQVVVGLPVRCEHMDPNLESELSDDEISIKFISSAHVNSIQIIQGIKAIVPCNYYYDKVSRKIMPNNLPALVKVRVSKSQELKNIEILSVIPEKITVKYKIKPEKSNSEDEKDFDEERTSDPSKEEIK